MLTEDSDDQLLAQRHTYSPCVLSPSLDIEDCTQMPSVSMEMHSLGLLGVWWGSFRESGLPCLLLVSSPPPPSLSLSWSNRSILLWNCLHMCKALALPPPELVDDPRNLGS